jgi:hypothetical protein
MHLAKQQGYFGFTLFAACLNKKQGTSPINYFNLLKDPGLLPVPLLYRQEH